LSAVETKPVAVGAYLSICKRNCMCCNGASTAQPGAGEVRTHLDADGVGW